MESPRRASTTATIFSNGTRRVRKERSGCSEETDCTHERARSRNSRETGDRERGAVTGCKDGVSPSSFPNPVFLPQFSSHPLRSPFSSFPSVQSPLPIRGFLPFSPPWVQAAGFATDPPGTVSPPGATKPEYFRVCILPVAR
jgi:hypothetical protein